MGIKKYLIGTDLSHHNDINLCDCGKQEFFFFKATEGKGYVDDKKNKYIADLAQANTIETMPFIGFYHYAHPEKNFPNEEADFFLTSICEHIGNCMCVLDYEGDALTYSASEKWAMRWLEYVQKNAGTTPIFYVQASALKYFPNIAKIYPLWIACYNQESRVEKYKKEVEQSNILQITSHPLDIDIFKGSRVEMAQIIKGVWKKWA